MSFRATHLPAPFNINVRFFPQCRLTTSEPRTRCEQPAPIPHRERQEAAAGSSVRYHGMYMSSVVHRVHAKYPTTTIPIISSRDRLTAMPVKRLESTRYAYVSPRSCVPIASRVYVEPASALTRSRLENGMGWAVARHLTSERKSSSSPAATCHRHGCLSRFPQWCPPW